MVEGADPKALKRQDTGTILDNNHRVHEPNSEELAGLPAESDDNEYFDEEGPDRGSRGKVVWIVLGLIAAVALAVFGGMMLGELAGLSRGGVTDVSTSSSPSSPAPVAEPVAVPSEIEPLPLPDALPSVAIATSLLPNSRVSPIEPGQWVRQDDLPRDLFRGESVSGIVAAYLTVIPDGSVTRCTVGNSSEVSPERFLRPAAVGVCRALRERATFAPFVVEPTPAPTPVPTPEPTLVAPIEQQQSPAPQPQAELKLPVEPPVAEREVFVRVAFRTADEPADSQPEE